MVSHGRSPILERLLSDGNQPENITATSCEQNQEGRNNQLEFLKQTQSQVVPYYADRSNDNLAPVSNVSTISSSIGENSAHYFNPSSVIWCAEDLHSVSPIPEEANAACMSNLFSTVQEPSLFTILPSQVMTDAYSPTDANLTRGNHSWENLLSTTRHQFNDEASNRLRHFTSPLSHLPYQQNGMYCNFASAVSDVNHQLYPYALHNETGLCAPCIGYSSTQTDTGNDYQSQIQVPGEISNENLSNFYPLNFVPHNFFNQYQGPESQFNSHMYNEIQYANCFQGSNYLNDSIQCQFSDISEDSYAREQLWTGNLSSDTSHTNEFSLETKPLSHQPLLTIKQPTKSSCIHETYNETCVSDFVEKLTMVKTEEPACMVKEASLSEKTQVDKSPKKKGAQKKWPCSICGRILARSSTLKIHLRQHSGDRPFKCPLCSKVFAQQSLLDSHMRTHSNERPYSCEICDKTFIRLSTFKTHTRTHTGERPHVCAVPNCGMAFTDTSTLSKHARVHSGVRPYICDICNRRFTQSGNLNKHRRTVHKVITNPMKIQESTKRLTESNESATSAMI